MKLSVLTVVLYHKTLEESLQYLNNLGVHSIELLPAEIRGRLTATRRIIWESRKKSQD